METSIDFNEHKAFYLNIQKAILLSLLDSKLLTKSQYDKAIEQLIKSHI